MTRIAPSSSRRVSRKASTAAPAAPSGLARDTAPDTTNPQVPAPAPEADPAAPPAAPVAPGEGPAFWQELSGEVPASALSASASEMREVLDVPETRHDRGDVAPGDDTVPGTPAVSALQSGSGPVDGQTVASTVESSESLGRHDEVDHDALKTQAARGGVWLGISAVLTKGSQIGLLLALAVLLNPRDLGLLAIGTLVFNIVMVIQDLGITDVINRSWEKGSQRAEEVARTALTITTAGAFVLVVFMWVFAPVLADLIGAPRATWVVRWMVLPVPFVAISWVQMARMQRDMAFQRRVIPDAVPALLGAATAIGLLVIHKPIGIWAMVIGNAVTCVLSPICARLVGYSVKPGWHWDYAKEILKWGRHSTPAAFLVLVTLNIDYILVARWLGEQQLGYYSLAFRISYVPFVLLVTVLNAAAFPYYVRMSSFPKLREAVEQVNNILAIFVFALCGALFLFAPAISLLGEQWRPAEGALRGLAVYAAINAVAHTVQLPLKAAGHVKLFFRAQALHLAVLFVCLIIFVPHGVTAVGVAQALAATVVLIASQIMLHRTIGWTLAELLRSLRVPAIATAAMAVTAWVLGLTGLRSDTWTGIIVLSVAALGIYGAVVWLLSRRNTVENLQMLRGRSA